MPASLSTVNSMILQLNSRLKSSTGMQNEEWQKEANKRSTCLIVTLKNLDQALLKIIKHYSCGKSPPTANLIKDKFLGKDEQGFTIKKLIDYHNQQEKASLEWGTMKNYYTIQKYLLQFLKLKMRTDDYLLSELNYKFITTFEIYLRRIKD